MKDELEHLIERQFKASETFVPARLQAAIALLQRLIEHPSLALSSHLSEAGQSIKSQEAFGAAAHARVGLEAVNKTHGRRSSNLHSWAPELLELLAGMGFDQMSSDDRARLIEQIQDRLFVPLRSIIEDEPIRVKLAGRSAEAVIAQALDIADQKGKTGAVAQYLVGAKLQQRFPELKPPIEVHAVNKGDRQRLGDLGARRGDFDLGDFVFEVAMGPPDTKHLEQIEAVLDSRDTEVWLVVRKGRLSFWADEIERCGVDLARLVIVSVEQFVGQNITELGQLSLAGKREQLLSLIDRYNTVWVAVHGPASIRIEAE